MSISFGPTDLFTQKIDCICTTIFVSSGDVLEGHEGCPGYVPIGEEIPSLNLSNDNAKNLFDLLLVPFDWDGTLEASDLLVKIAFARKYPLVEYARSSEVEGNHYYGALTERQLQGYLDGLSEVANFALERELTVSWF